MTYTDIIKSISLENLEQAVINSKSNTGVLRHIGIITRNGRLINLIDEKIKEYSIDTNHFCKPPIYDLNEVLVENSTYNNQTLKVRLVKEGLLEYECACCGNPGVWNEKELVLQLDHINGINNDNRLENLRFLCPNCHSQTETFGGRNIS